MRSAIVALALTLSGCTVSAIAPQVVAPIREPRLPDEVSYDASIQPIAGPVRARISWSWQKGCPVALEDLRLLTMTYWGFDGRTHNGEMIVHERYARGITDVFRKLFAVRFPLETMVLADTFPQNDQRRIAANVTTGFVCRKSVAAPRRWSSHAYGIAIDVNPLRNPYVSRSGQVIPRWGKPYVDRSKREPGMITTDGVVVRAFKAIGWKWGGTYRRSKDYHHFSANGQ